MHRIAALALAVSLAATLRAPSPAFAAAVDDAPMSAAITRAALASTVEWLAAPALGGRLAGSPGYLTAAKGMADRLRDAGLAPAGSEGFLQPVEVEWNDIRTCALERVDADGTRHPLRLGEDFTCRGLTGSRTVTAPVVFAGYGLSWPERGYDDYAGLDVRGKIVLAFKEAPPFQVDSTGWGPRALPRPRARVAAARGAVGLLLVPRTGQPHPQKPIASMLEGPGPQEPRFPSFQVDQPVAEALLEGSGTTLAALQSLIDSTRAPHSRALGASLRAQVAATYHPHQRSVNVLARLEGADPARRDEVVVIGAHLDHVGTQAGLMFPGANDNASGAAALLQIARAFARGPRPARTVVFALFTSEEAGLHGAKAFVAKPPVPLASIVAYLNLDCVGFGDSLQVGGGKTYAKLYALARAADAAESRRLIAATWPGGGADAQPFHEAGIPTAYFASWFSYTHLHLPSDTPETLNGELHEAIARTAYRTAWSVAQGAEVREAAAAAGHEAGAGE